MWALENNYTVLSVHLTLGSAKAALARVHARGQLAGLRKIELVETGYVIGTILAMIAIGVLLAWRA
jgi:hypothetical protein